MGEGAICRVVLGQLPQSVRLGPRQSSLPSCLTELPPGQLKAVVEVSSGSSTSCFYYRDSHRVGRGQHKGRELHGVQVLPCAFPDPEGSLSLWGWQEAQRVAKSLIMTELKRGAQIGSLCSK